MVVLDTVEELEVQDYISPALIERQDEACVLVPRPDYVELTVKNILDKTKDVWGDVVWYVEYVSDSPKVRIFGVTWEHMIQGREG